LLLSRSIFDVLLSNAAVAIAIDVAVALAVTAEAPAQQNDANALLSCACPALVVLRSCTRAAINVTKACHARTEQGTTQT
jgi:hypothetical protein